MRQILCCWAAVVLPAQRFTGEQRHDRTRWFSAAHPRKKSTASCQMVLSTGRVLVVIYIYIPDTPWDCHICRSVGVVPGGVNGAAVLWQSHGVSVWDIVISQMNGLVDRMDLVIRNPLSISFCFCWNLPSKTPRVQRETRGS